MPIISQVILESRSVEHHGTHDDLLHGYGEGDDERRDNVEAK